MIQHFQSGESERPAGLSFKEFFYECFEKDVARGKELENPRIPKHSAFSLSPQSSQVPLRLVSFNVHFFQRGFSNVLKGSSHEEVLQILSELNADVLLLQEVPQSAVADLARRLAAMGYPHHVAAGSADAHVLSADSAAYPRERLHVMVASRLAMRRSAAVPMLDGHAAFAELSLGTHAGALCVYSAHLSVRCDASKRRREMEALLRHARDAAAGGAVLVGGDFNQPNAGDYPPHEWAAIAADLARAQLALTDGVMDTLRADGYTPSWEAATTQTPLAATSAWNGAVVDYIYAKLPAAAAAARGGGGGGTGGALWQLLGVEASYFYHTLASDHLPLVVDYAVG